jgi:hypothetical protein
MIYPKPTIKMKGGCLAVSTRDGRPRVLKAPQRPKVLFEGEYWSCARLSYHLNVASITMKPVSQKEGLVLHKCDNGWCVNPKHLYLGTAKQNTADIWKRNKKFTKAFREKMKGNQLGKMNLGKKHTEEQKMKHSELMKGWKWPRSVVEKRAAGLRGKTWKWSEEALRNHWRRKQ